MSHRRTGSALGPLVFDPPVGRVHGWNDDAAGVRRASGIPYARAERFAQPEPVTNLDREASYPGWEASAPGEPFHATQFAPCPPQGDDREFAAIFGPQRRDLGVSEHCQRLSITMPRDARADEALPVMVWIHGGSYVSGCGDSSVTDPAPLVREHRVIVVSVTYRLGLLGYLGTRYSGANLGLQDQELAFMWVRRNIAAFGGDPARVTAYGESAGADSIAHLMAAMGARMRRGKAKAAADKAAPELLFDRAILLSPPLGIRRNRERMTGVMRSLVDARVDPQASLAELVALQEKVASRVGHHGLAGMMPFGTQYGHEPLPAEDEVDQAWRDIAPLIPVMISSTGTETSLFAHTMPAARRLARLPLIGPRAYWALVALTSALTFTRPASEFAAMWASAGGSAHRFRIPWSVPGNPMRSPHAIDVALLYAREDTWHEVEPFHGATWEEVERAARDLRRYLADFATGRREHPFTKEHRTARA